MFPAHSRCPVENIYDENDLFCTGSVLLSLAWPQLRGLAVLLVIPGLLEKGQALAKKAYSP